MESAECNVLLCKVVGTEDETRHEADGHLRLMRLRKRHRAKEHAEQLASVHCLLQLHKCLGAALTTRAKGHV